MMTAARPDVSVVFPCLNEAGTVGSCVARARRAFDDAGVDCEVVVCDNGSTDGSQLEAEEAGARVVSEPRRGYGSAYLTGLAEAKGRVLVLADADGTYPLEEAPEFARLAAEKDALVLGSRFSGEILPGSMPILHRLVGSPATRLLLRLLFRVRCDDPHSGMRALTQAVFERVRPASRGMEFAIEMVVNATRRSVPIIERPITYAPRIGESKLRALPDGWSLLRFLLLHSPTFLFVIPGLAALIAGASLLGWLAMADRQVGRASLGVNTLVVGALATIVGYQILAFGASARAYIRAASPSDYPTGELFDRWFTLERGIGLGVVLLVAGIGMIASVGARWLAVDFGDLSRSAHGVAVLGLTTAVLGIQTVFSSFLISLLMQNAPSRSPR